MGEVKGRDKETRRKRGKKGRKEKSEDKKQVIGDPWWEREGLSQSQELERKLCRRDGSVVFFRL